MNMDPDIARLASLVTEPARAAIMLHLLDGRSWTATELAKVAGVRASAASAHLKKLLENDLINVSPGGRHRYFRLAGAEIASLIEQLARSSPSRQAATPGQRRASVALRACRICYDHLAGRLGVEITAAMVRKSWVIEKEPWYVLTDLGAKELSALDIEPTVGRTCMDWSERRLHLAGVLGAAIAERLIRSKFLLRDSKSRALRITSAGVEAIGGTFGIDVRVIQSAP
jgi:DNA-binding transcriptional ArsR family regulator